MDQIRWHGRGGQGVVTAASILGAGAVVYEGRYAQLLAILAAHGIPYAATASVAYPTDYMEKVKKAVEADGPAYIHVLAPCPPGWGADSAKTIEIGKLAVDCGLWVLAESEHGVTRITRKPGRRVPVAEYLKTQGRFKHLKPDEVEEIQRQVNERWAAAQA